jgi:hypothetical protein
MTKRILLAMGTMVGSLFMGACAHPQSTWGEVGGHSSEQSQRVMAEISASRLRTDIDTLVSFGTRHTLSDTSSDAHGIGAARRWIRRELEAAAGESRGRMTVAFEEFQAPKSVRLPDGGTLVNVVGTLKGSDPAASQRTYYVVGHYDSRNGEAMDASGDAPGANDDGSGTAAVLEIARALSKEELKATVVFLLTAGEEQGLIGAKYHADQARARGVQIGGVLSNDIIGGRSADRERRAQIRVFSEGVPRNPSAEEHATIRNLAMEHDSPSRALARYVADVATLERTAITPVLVFRPDRFLRGGDHSAFNEAGFPAVRFTEFDENYERQHANVTVTTDASGRVARHGDLPEYVDEASLAEVARLNAAVLVHLANAPAPPGNVRLITATLTNDTDIRWEASAGAAGYEVVWRATTSSQWEHVQDVGNATQVVIPRSKDDWFFGVRAYRADGFKSPVVFAGAAKE